jgi:UDP-3-O-[3-hydroxymyristoyl] glucosamine N-acyltransferase
MKPMTGISLSRVAELSAGDLEGDGALVVTRVSSLEEAGPDDLALVAHPKYLAYLADSRAGALLVARRLRAGMTDARPRVVATDPHLALARVLSELTPARSPHPGIHPTAVIAPDAQLSKGVHVGAHAVVEAGASLGEGCVVEAHSVVGEGCSLGAGTRLFPHVTLYPGVELGARCAVHSGTRLGADGFGYAFDGREHVKVPQIGGCRIGDDVEIGANCTVDRGSIGDTVIESGSKLDAQVHIGHNVRLGRNVIVVAQTGISGSTVLGDGVVVGGQAGIGGHLRIGAGARIGAQAGVMGDVEERQTVSGYPARPHRESLRASAGLLRVPEILQRLKSIEKTIGE